MRRLDAARRPTPAGGEGDKGVSTNLRRRRLRHRKTIAGQRGDGRRIAGLGAVSGQSLGASSAGGVRCRGNRIAGVPAVQVGGYGRVTILDAPHRIYDAIFRDSLLDGTPFRESTVGQRLVAANNRNATALYELYPTMLLFGGWDSHGGDNGRGAKIPRALTSEIIGLRAVTGVRTSSRIDPLGITVAARTIFQTERDGWTLNPEEATRNRDNALQRRGDGRPSEIGHLEEAKGFAQIRGYLSTARKNAVNVFGAICDKPFIPSCVAP